MARGLNNLSPQHQTNFALLSAAFSIDIIPNYPLYATTTYDYYDSLSSMQRIVESNPQRLDETLMISSDNIVYDNALSEQSIDINLKTRDPRDDKEREICVVCQDDTWQENEKIGILKCGHEYHAKCIKKWLLQKNLCPLCKAVAVPNVSTISSST